MRTGSRGGPSRGPARVASRAARTRRWRFSGAFPCTERRLRASLGTCRERPLELCANEWRSGIRRTPQVACSACDHRELVPLSDAVLDRHLTGQCTVGVYPFFTDESCGGLRPISMRREGARLRLRPQGRGCAGGLGGIPLQGGHACLDLPRGDGAGARRVALTWERPSFVTPAPIPAR